MCFLITLSRRKEQEQMKKRFTLLFITLLMLLMMSPLTSFAAPQGYMEVKLTKKNFKQYFELIKVKRLDAFGGYDGYEVHYRSKLLKKGYYIYSTKGVAIQGTFKRRSKFTSKSGKKTITHTNTYTQKLPNAPLAFMMTATDEDYNYAKVWDVEIKNVKGTIIFAEPSNIIEIKRRFDESNSNHLYSAEIRIRYPYDDDTRKKTHWDDATIPNGIDYYYFNDNFVGGKQLLG